MAVLAGRILTIHIERLQRGARANGNEPINVFFLPKLGHTEDVFASIGGDKRFSIFGINQILIKAVYWAFLPIEYDDNNYRSDLPEIERQKRALRAIWLRILPPVIKKYRPDIILTGNYSYAAEQELWTAFEHYGVPVLALHKECLKSAGLESFYEDIYRHRKVPFRGTKICVYNEVEKRIQVAAGVAPPDKIVITGVPRLDRVHRLRAQAADGRLGRTTRQKQVLFFSFKTKTGLPIIGRKGRVRYEYLAPKLDGLNWGSFVGECHWAVVELARRYPELKVVIKAKNDSQAFETLFEVFGKDFVLPVNLEIATGGDPLKLIAGSDVVCGFNSTALFESLAMKKPVVVPRFSEGANEKLAPYVLDLENAVEYAFSSDELIDKLRDIALRTRNNMDDTTLDEATQRILDRWMGNPHGHAGERVKKVIIDLVEDNRRQAARRACVIPPRVA
ncbi:MAG: hypothetical protein L0Z68_04850 [Gammaproteobacteria bacterium]|nr:hypothetical protein [Gammaproteobacteria bacterium]